ATIECEPSATLAFPPARASAPRCCDELNVAVAPEFTVTERPPASPANVVAPPERTSCAPAPLLCGPLMVIAPGPVLVSVTPPAMLNGPVVSGSLAGRNMYPVTGKV